MLRRSAWGAAGLALLLLAGCYPPHRASRRVLAQRAIYDLGCPREQLQIYALDSRTQVVAGCGRRLVYVERCDAALGRDACSWLLDTPFFQQTQWPQHQAARAQRRALPPPAPPAPLPSVVSKDGEGAVDPLDVPARPRPGREQPEPFGTAKPGDNHARDDELGF